MKLTLGFSVLLVGWVTMVNSDSQLMEKVSESMADWIGASLAVAAVVSLLAAITRSGGIRLEAEYLEVKTPAGLYRIPYSRIETIRRCRRSRGENSHYLQIGFQSLGERKVLQLRPPSLARFTEMLRERCPHLSSSRSGSLIRQSGYQKLIHPSNFLAQRSKAGYRETVF